MTDSDELQAAIALREAGDVAAARDRLVALALHNTDDAQVHYQAAWAHDILGEERAAVPYYERAIAFGLEGDDLRGAYIGLGSTLRTLGEYERAEATLRAALGVFPTSGAVRTFLAMALYNRDRYHEAMQLLLGELARSEPDPEIASYRRAIALYAEDLDRRCS